MTALAEVAEVSGASPSYRQTPAVPDMRKSQRRRMQQDLAGGPQGAAEVSLARDCCEHQAAGLGRLLAVSDHHDRRNGSSRDLVIDRGEYGRGEAAQTSVSGHDRVAPRGVRIAPARVRLGAGALRLSSLLTGRRAWLRVTAAAVSSISSRPARWARATLLWDSECRPQCRLRGRCGVGFRAAWPPRQPTALLSVRMPSR